MHGYEETLQGAFCGSEPRNNCKSWDQMRPETRILLQIWPVKDAEEN